MKLQHPASLVRSFDRLCHVSYLGAVVGLVSPSLVFRRVKERLDCGPKLTSLEKRDVIDIFAKRGTYDQIAYALNHLSPDLAAQKKLAIRLLDLISFDFAIVSSPNPVLGINSVVLDPQTVHICSDFIENKFAYVRSLSFDSDIKAILICAVNDPANYALRSDLYEK